MTNCAAAGGGRRPSCTGAAAPSFNCTEACPREIRITKAIGEVKKAILKGSARAEPIRHAAASGA